MNTNPEIENTDDIAYEKRFDRMYEDVMSDPEYLTDMVFGSHNPMHLKFLFGVFKTIITAINISIEIRPTQPDGVYKSFALEIFNLLESNVHNLVSDTVEFDMDPKNQVCDD